MNEEMDKDETRDNLSFFFTFQEIEIGIIYNFSISITKRVNSYIPITYSLFNSIITFICAL